MPLNQERGFQVLRSLYRELRPGVRDPYKYVYQTPTWKHITSKCRECPPPSHPQYEEVSGNLIRVGEYYAYSIKGTRDYLKIQETYKGKGERSPQDLAKILGFRMPDEPKEERKAKK